MEYKTLGELCDVVSGGTPSRSKHDYRNGDIPWIKIGNIKSRYISEADEFIWPSLDHSYNTNLTRCLGGKKQFAILNDGSLCLCCLDYKGSTKIGNLFIDDFSILLQNRNYLEAISGFNKRKPYFELCKKCTYRNRFK